MKLITAGVDIGSTTSKAVLLEEDTILGQAVINNKSLPAESADEVFERCCIQSGVNKRDIEAIATTGYGRRLAQFGDMVITEIKSCALGALFIKSPYGEIRTIVDVGGQDTKIIALNEDGDIEDFAMNDKCAAGTGRFLEMLADKLDLSYEEFVEQALSSNRMIHMNATCAVFAESEVISLLARGVDKSDIAAGAHDAVASRISSMIRRVGQAEVFCFTGGGALNRALIKAIEENLNKRLYVPDNPQTVAALGAAICARNKLQRKANGG
ncbi:MAG: acyl-CoA dehydratase activase [bacterium]